MSGRKQIYRLIAATGDNSAVRDNITVRRRNRPRRGTSGAMSTPGGATTYDIRVTPVGHGVSGHPVTGGMGSYNAYYNTTITPAQTHVSTQSDYNAFPNTAVAAPNTLLEQVAGTENYSPLRPVALNFNDNDFTAQPREGAPAIIPTDVESQIEWLGTFRSPDILGYGMANQEAHDQFTLIEEETGGGAFQANMATPHQARQQVAHQTGNVGASYLGQRYGDGLHSGDPTISHYVSSLGTTPMDEGYQLLVDDDDLATPLLQYVQPENPIHTVHQSSQVETNIRHGQENGSTNQISQIADQVSTPQGNNWHQQTAGINQPMAPVTNNSGTGTHPSMVGPSGAPMPSTADEAYRLMIQQEPSLLDLAPAAEIPVMPGQSTILGVKTAWANPGYNKYVGPVYA
jgi:hypothetical protein